MDDSWVLRVAELNIQYYERLLADGVDPSKAVIIHRLLVAERETLQRLRREQSGLSPENFPPNPASASD